MTKTIDARRVMNVLKENEDMILKLRLAAGKTIDFDKPSKMNRNRYSLEPINDKSSKKDNQIAD